MTSESTGTITPVLPPAPRAGIDFESLPWNLNEPEAHKYIHVTTTAGDWTSEHYDASSDTGLILTEVKPYAATPLDLYPSTTSLNYGTTIWEGLKCYRTASGRAAVFRPDKNHARFSNGAYAMCLPPPSYELFMRGVQAAVMENKDLIPPFGDGMKLYIRPMLLGSGQQLGLHPSPRISLLFYVSPTGNYFKGKSAGLNLHLETIKSRAARGGMGAVKCSGNYGSTLRPLANAKKQGFDDNIYLELDSYQKGQLDKALLQELSAANIFLVLKTGEIVTPSLDRGTILPGVTRDSVLALAKEYSEELKAAMIESTGDDSVNVTISERDVTVGELRNATEVFITGTAAELVPLASIATGENEEEFITKFPHGATLPGGPVTAKLLSILREIMYGTRSCKMTEGWLKDPLASPEDFRTGSM
uniref:Branched-chain-amino-acid aminotransferase n=1 Tax=Attheya septentrionalis TaxID=420275 RepID=A0A7S2UCA0_9STRA|eukprot:CAMPEP_0198282002 /NCGR_PEP_ID=MMETSP1449-20131203/1882_1 /TAXON_ID=420275 /ORGANISM="Attheya septentrionalis, Strain CCMP2084" /LENGTH=417 /DNA_ID=CAMNT_0043978069 /DNA_START=44 /DNA_END=1297 /DNA_ORIENTATION=+